MHRAAVIAFAAGFLIVQICCAPPLRAAAVEAAEPMQCPIQKQECENAEKAECSGGPQLVGEFPTKPHASLSPSSIVLVLGVDTPRTRDEGPSLTSWSTPTKTIQLRI